MKVKYIVIMLMCGSKKEAMTIVDLLLKKRLIACANIVGGVESRFWWKGKIDKAREVMVIMKSRGSKFGRIQKEVIRMHSYDVPEIIALAITRGSKEYLGWIADTVV